MTRAAENLFLLTTAGRESPFLGEITGLVDREEYLCHSERSEESRFCCINKYGVVF